MSAAPAPRNLQGSPMDEVRQVFPVPGYVDARVIEENSEGYKPGTSTNPKDAIGSTKLPLHLWPAEATAMGCLGMLEGAMKYGRNNFIVGDGVVASIYVDAAKRHLDAWMAGENNTHDVGAPHLANALASLAILVKAQAHGKLVDDRDYGAESGGKSYRRLIEELTPHVSRIKNMFRNQKPKHYTIKDNT